MKVLQYYEKFASHVIYEEKLQVFNLNCGLNKDFTERGCCPNLLREWVQQNVEIMWLTSGLERDPQKDCINVQIFLNVRLMGRYLMETIIISFRD